MSSIRQHIEAQHPEITDDELRFAERDKVRTRVIHAFFHAEYGHRIDHWHTEHGQLIEGTKSEEPNHSHIVM